MKPRGFQDLHPLPRAAQTRGEPDVEAWRAHSCRSVVEFSERMQSVMPVKLQRLRTLLAAGEIDDAAVRGTMLSLNLNFDHVLIVIGAFIEGGAYEWPASECLRDEVAALRKVGLVQVARSGRSVDGWSGLTEPGRQLAVYTIYRLFAAAADDGNPDE